MVTRSTDDIHNDRLDKIFVMMLDPNPHVSERAITAMRGELAKLNVHGSQIRLIFDRGDLLQRLYQQIEQLEARAEQAEQEVSLLRREAPKEVLAKVRVATSSGFISWDELMEVLQPKVEGRKGWKGEVARILGVTKHEMYSFERGLKSVPVDVIEKARAMPKLAARRRRKGKHRDRMTPPIPPGTVVKEHGPMSKEELWLIGDALKGGDWLAGAAGAANASAKTITGWQKRGVPQAQADLLRRRYRERHGPASAHHRHPDNDEGSSNLAAQAGE